MENSVEQSFLIINEAFNSYHLGSVFEILFFIVSTIFIVNNLSLKEEACKKAFYFKENSQKENLD
jgi:hypothetical protein